MSAAAKQSTKSCTPFGPELLDHWHAVASVLIPPANDEELARTIDLLDQVLDAGGSEEGTELGLLADYLGDLVYHYEQAHLAPPPAATGVEMMQFLMEREDLKQSDLPEVGSQGVVSELLNGKRELNARQIRALAERFGMPAGNFI